MDLVGQILGGALALALIAGAVLFVVGFFAPKVWGWRRRDIGDNPDGGPI